jgi:hypothetical protein
MTLTNSFKGEALGSLRPSLLPAGLREAQESEDGGGGCRDENHCKVTLIPKIIMENKIRYKFGDEVTTLVDGASEPEELINAKGAKVRTGPSARHIPLSLSKIQTGT